MNRPAANSNGGRVCPYLGLRDDSETALYYPSSLNHCFRAKPATPLKSEYQGTCCLTATYSECRVYQQEPGFPLPPDLRNRQHGSAHRKRFKIRLWVIVFVLVIIGLLIWQSLSSGLFRFAGREHPVGETVPVLLTETLVNYYIPPPLWVACLRSLYGEKGNSRGGGDPTING